MKITEIKAALWGNPPFTWQGHAWMSGQVGVPVLVALKALGVLPAELAAGAYAGLCLTWMAFYLVREANDEMHHRVRGDYDQPQAGQKLLTSRVDKIGDFTGPVAVAMTALTAWLFTVHGWWWPLIPFAATTFALLRAAVRIVRRTCE